LDSALATLELARTRITQNREEHRAGRPRDPLRPGGVAGMTMQFVVGATSDTDADILGRVTDIYAGGGMHHSQFSAFRPISETPMEATLATPALREHRLYQADHLLRDYGFSRDEVVFGADGNLPLSHDPKTAWALANPDRFPVEIRTASREALARVPGIGPVSARRIVAERSAVAYGGRGEGGEVRGV